MGGWEKSSFGRSYVAMAVCDVVRDEARVTKAETPLSRDVGFVYVAKDEADVRTRYLVVWEGSKCEGSVVLARDLGGRVTGL